MHRQFGDLGGGEGDLSEIWFTTGKSWTHIFVRTRLWKAPAGKQALELELSLLKRRVSGLRWHAMTSTASPPLFVRDFHCSPPPLFVRCSFGMGDAGSGEGGSFLLFPDTSTRIA